jgi:hypothetical protein
MGDRKYPRGPLLADPEIIEIAQVARCASGDHDPNMWYEVFDLKKILDAKDVCAACLVRERCLEYALRSGETWGIWGGLTARERKVRYGSAEDEDPDVHV